MLFAWTHKRERESGFHTAVLKRTGADEISCNVDKPITLQTFVIIIQLAFQGPYALATAQYKSLGI